MPHAKRRPIDLKLVGEVLSPFLKIEEIADYNQDLSLIPDI